MFLSLYASRIPDYFITAKPKKEKKKKEEKKGILSHYACTRKVKMPENTRVIPNPNKPDPIIGTIQWIEENLHII